MSLMQGKAKRYDGSTIDYVQIFNWATGQCLGVAVPNTQGIWTYNYYRDLVCGITYVADGCQPITHGPYTFTVPKQTYKWWRVINIQNRVRASPLYSHSIGRLLFDNVEGIPSNNPLKAFALNSYNNLDRFSAGKAFNGTNTDFANSAEYAASVINTGWYIGYEFDVPVTVTDIKIQARSDITEPNGQEWQSADVEVSSDGINWVKVGRIAPNVAKINTSLITTPLLVGD